jgi:hypothetical protein
MRIQKIFILMLLGLCLNSGTLFSQQGTTDEVCQSSQDQLRYYFMEYNPEGFLNLKYLEDLYFACDSPSLSSTISYYYLKSASLLQGGDNFVAKPSELFYYFYQKFQGAAQLSGDLMAQDPDFVATLARRSDRLAQEVARAERLGDQPFLNGRPEQGAANRPEQGSNQRLSGADRGSRPATQRTSLNNLVVPSDEKDFPFFSYPPPQYSDVAPLPSPAFSGNRRLGEVNDRLCLALNNEGYYGKHYFSVPDGFALLTQLERFFPDGRSMTPLERWRRSVNPPVSFSLREYFLSLVFAEPGYYRMFAFVVVPRSVAENPRLGMGRLNPNVWKTTEGEKLPFEIAQMPFSADYTVQAFVFEFWVTSQNGEAYLLERKGEGREGMSAAEHLERARLWEQFKL